MDRAAFDEAVRAHVCVAYFRELRMDMLRRLAVVSLFLWYQGAARILPATVGWILGLAAAVLAALAAIYAALEIFHNPPPLRPDHASRLRARAGRFGVR